MQGRPLLHLLPALRVTGSWWPPRIAAVPYVATQAGRMLPWLMLRRRQAATPRLRATITLALALVLMLVLVLVLVMVMVLMRGWRQIVMVLMVLPMLPMLLMALQLHRRPTSVPRSVPPSGLPLMWVPQPWAV